jgi:hypothetical protein
MAEYAATGLPPGFVPKDDRAVRHEPDESHHDNEEPR